MTRIRRALSLERLDDRITPAIAVSLTSNGILNVTGTPNSFLNVTQTANNVINVKDGVVNYGNYTAPAGLNVMVQRFNQGIMFDVGNFTYTGNVNIDLGLGSLYAGLREVSVFDSTGTAGGLGKVAANVTIRNGNGSEYISIGRPAIATGSTSLPVQVNGNVFISTRYNAGPDTFELTAGSIVQGSIYTSNVDIVTLGVFDPGNPVLATVGGNVVATNPTPAIAFLIDTFANIAGSLTVASNAGSTAQSSLLIEDGTTIGGNVTSVFSNGNNVFFFGSLVQGQPAPVIEGSVNLLSGTGNDSVLMIDDLADGDNATILGSFNATLGQGNNVVSYDSKAVILGSMTISAGNGNNQINGVLSTYFAGLVGGNLQITLGNGNNSIDFGGTVSGNQVLFQTGGGTDLVTIEASANAMSAKLVVYLGAGNDTFNLNSNSFGSGYIDGGTGTGDDYNTTVIISIPWTVTGFEV